jgi:hypothetical protein
MMSKSVKKTKAKAANSILEIMKSQGHEYESTKSAKSPATAQ